VLRFNLWDAHKWFTYIVPQLGHMIWSLKWKDELWKMWNAMLSFDSWNLNEGSSLKIIWIEQILFTYNFGCNPRLNMCFWFKSTFWNCITIITKATWAQLSFYFSFLDEALLKQPIFFNFGNGTKELPYCNEVAHGCNYCKWVWINLTNNLIPCIHLFTWLKSSNAWFWVALKMKNGCIHTNMNV
jgi:hypothetical protein